MLFTDPLDILYDQIFDNPDKSGMTPLMKKAHRNAKLSPSKKEQEEILTASLVVHFDIIPYGRFHVIEDYIKNSKFDNLHIRETYAQYILGGGAFSSNVFKAYLIKFVQSMGFKMPISIIESVKDDIEETLYSKLIENEKSIN